MNESNTQCHWAVVTGIKHYPSMLNIFFRYMQKDGDWPNCIRIESAVYDSMPELYHKASKLKRGDMVLANPVAGHDIIDCCHCNLATRLKNLIKL